MTASPPIKNPKIKRKKHRKRHKKQKSVPLLVFSSLVFITNVITALYKSDFIYAALFALLTATSIAFHSKKCHVKCSALLGEYSNTYRYALASNFAVAILDKLAIYSIVCYGFWSLYNLNLESNMGSYLWRGLILSTFCFCIWIYYYGYTEKQFCFHPNKKTSNHYHALLHMVGSIGHHMIILSKN